MTQLSSKGMYVLIIVSVIVIAVALAVVYRNKQFDKGASALKSQNYTEAMNTLKPLAEMGDSMSQYLLGQMFAFGWGVNKDDTKAMEWFRRAGMWYSGQGDKAAEAAYYVGEQYAEKKKYDEAIKWYRTAAEGGSRQAAEALAKAYEDATLGLERNMELASSWREKAKNALPSKAP